MYIFAAYYAMKAYTGVEVQLHAFLTLAIGGMGGQLHTLTTLLLEKQPLVPSGWVSVPIRMLCRGLQKKNDAQDTSLTFKYVKKSALDC